MKYISRHFTVFVILVVILSHVNAQNFGGVPSKKKWASQTVNDVEIIFDNTIKHTADTIANILNSIDRVNPYSLGDNKEFLHLIVRNENLTSNGFVSYFPYRSEFFIHGAQNPNSIGMGEWIKLLSYHEYRHALQYSNFNYGITKLIRSVLGDASVAGIYNFLVPDWFSEGDAVFYETALTNNGRGRLPSFTSDLRAILMDSIHYSYEKYRNGSFKDLVPNEYVMGYILATYGHQNYGPEFWKTTLQETGKLKGLFFPFSKAVKRNSQTSLKKFYHNAFKQYSQDLPYTEKLSNTDQFVFVEDKNIKDEIVTFQFQESFILLENSYDEITSIYKIDNKKERSKLFELGNSTDPFIQKSANRVLYINKHVHPRWTNREYGDIWYYDLETHKTKQVTKNKKYLSCDYYDAHNSYAAVTGTTEGKYSLLLLNNSGIITDTIVSSTMDYLASPIWGDKGRFLYYTSRKNGAMSLHSYDIQLNEINTLISKLKGTISRPYINNKYVYFSSSLSGIDNIYRYHLESGNTIQITDVTTGAYAPAVDENDSLLYYSISTSNGKRIFQKKIDEPAISVNLNARRSSQYDSNWTPEYNKETFVSRTPISPKSKPYKPLLHIFNFHSLFLSPSLETPRLSLLSNDYLNTTKAEIYGQYYDADQSFKTGVELTYAKWFPEISAGANHRFNRTLNIRTNQNLYTIPKSETSLSGSVRLPLVFSSRQNNHFLIMGSQFDLTQEHFDPSHSSLPDNFNIQPRIFQRTQGEINWQITRRKAYRDIFPKWGFLLRGVYKRGWSPEVSELTYLRSEVYLPGFFANDGWKLRVQGQWNSDLAGSYLPFELATSSNIQYDPSSFRKGSFLTANYLFPVAYPEIAVPHFLFTKRIALNFFGEYFISGDNRQSAYGVDLFLTARYFNLLDLTVGLRAQMVNKKELEFGVVFLQNL